MRQDFHNGGVTYNARVSDNRPPSGISKLPRTITINGTTVDSATSGFFYDFTLAQGAAGSLYLPEANDQANGYLTEAGGGALTRGAGGPFSDGSTGVTGDGTGYLSAAGSTFADPGNDDFFGLLTFGATGASATRNMLFSKRDGVNAGILAYEHTTGQVAIVLDDGTDQVILWVAALAADEFCVVAFAGNKDGEGYTFHNGSASAGVNISSVGSMANSGTFGLLGPSNTNPAPIGEGTATLYAAAMWHAPDLFSAGAAGAAEMQALASELTSHIFGTYAPLASNADQHLSVSRSGTRYFDVGGSVYPLGANGHCVEEDADGAQYLSVYGERTSKITDSDDFTAWTLRTTGIAAISANNATGPEPGTLADLITVDARGADDLYLYLGAGTFANSTVNAPALWIKRSSTSGILSIRTPAANAGLWNIDFSTLPDSWVRLTTASPYVSVDTPFVSSASGEAGLQLYEKNDATISFWAAGAQQEDGFVEAGPTIRTTGTAATKSAEALSLDADMMPDNEWTVELTFRKYATPSVTVPIFSYSDGTSAENFQIGITAAGYINAICDSAGGDNGAVTGSTDLCDGSWHSIRVAARNSYLRVEVDGTVVGTDTSCTVPAAPDTVYLGANYNASVFFDGDFRWGSYAPRIVSRALF